MLKKFGMDDCKPIGTPTDVSQKLSLSEVSGENTLVGKVPYQRAIGSLLYVSERTRPDIAFAVNYASRYNQNHSSAHWQAVKRIFRYLRGTMHLKLKYRCGGLADLHGFTDADWASEIDERRSVSGFVFKLSGGAISWQSKRQAIVALSSTEAEYIALSSVVCESLWLRQLTNELDKGAVKPIKIFCDNESSIRLAENDAYRPRTKHIDTRFHHTRQQIEAKFIDVEHVSTKLMTADFLTKGVPKEKHNFCAEQSGLA